MSWLHWLLLWPLFVLTALVVVFYTFSVVANVIAARRSTACWPSGSKNGQPGGRNATNDRVDLERTAAEPLTELSKLLYFIGWAIPLLVLSFVPVVNVAAPVLWALFSAWMLALEYSDYPLGNRGLSFRDQRRLLRKRWPLTLSFGGADPAC
ncbi:MAG: EI24 domain-containing protein [Candidatus Competibacteraceae bacterium]